MRITRLENSDIGRLGEIDRSEHISLEYVMQGGELIAKQIDCDVPNWSRDATSDFRVPAMINQFAPILENGGVMLGACDGERLAGFAVLRYNLEDGVSQLAALYVDKGYRRRGVAAALTDEVIRLARESGARQLYVSAVPSESAVGFYRARGFAPTERVNDELFRLEPEDIHMTLDLGA